MIDDLADGELPKAPSFVRPMIIGRATRPVDALTSRSSAADVREGDLT